MGGFNARPFAPTFGAKKDATVATSATAAALLANAVGGPIQVRIVNYDTVRVAYRFGGDDVEADLAADPSLAAGAVEVITVFPPQLGPGDIYFSVIGDTGASGEVFEATPGQGL